MILAALAVLAGSWALRSQFPGPSKGDAASEEYTSQAADVRTERIDTRRAATADRSPFQDERPGKDNVTSGVTIMPAVAAPAQVLPALSGYVVDRFVNWTTIPEGYSSDGIALKDGTITLAGDPASTAPRFGQLVSPPLPLKSPAMAAPVPNSRQLPPDVSLMLELSLSDDGETWSPWVAVEKYVAPDGKRVTPPLQASISEQQLVTAQTGSTAAPVSGPSLRYRLTLSAGSSPSPALADIRIWKRELP